MLFLTVSLLMSLGFFWLKANQRVSPPILAVTEPTASLERRPSAIPSSQISPDGAATLTLKTNGDTVSIMANDLLVANIRLSPNERLLLPFNTWSPDDKYFFVQKTGAGSDEYLVMSASGKTFRDGSLELPVAGLFSSAHPDFSLTAVTGWASPTLIVINSTSQSGTPASFWLDITTSKFIRLSSYFN